MSGVKSVKDDLLWAPLSVNNLVIHTFMNTIGSTIKELHGFPLVQAICNVLIYVIKNCLKLLEFINLGKAAKIKDQ